MEGIDFSDLVPRVEEPEITSCATTGPGPAVPTAFNGSGGRDGSAASYAWSLTYMQQVQNLKKNWRRPLYLTGRRFESHINFEVIPYFSKVVAKVRVNPFLDSSELGSDLLPRGRLLWGARMSSLELAILMGDLKMVKTILDSNSVPHNVIYGQKQDLVSPEFLIKLAPSSDTFKETRILYTPLHLAVTGGDSDIVDAILEEGVDVNAPNWEGQTPVDLAYKQNDFTILQQLLAKDSEKKDLLHVAVRHGDIDFIKRSPSLNVNVMDQKKERPLHLAVDGGDSDIVDALLEKGADVNAPNWKGQTPLDLACKHKNVTMMQKLLAKDSEEKDLLLHIAVLQGNVDFIKKSPSLNVNAMDYKKETPLHWAVDGGDSDIVDALLEKGADVNALNCKGQTPLDLACKHKDVTMMQKLLAKDSEKKDLLHIAVQHGNIDFMRKLSFQNVKAMDHKKRTVLHYLATKHFDSSHITDIVRYLAQDKALDFKVLDDSNLSAFYVAVLDCNTQFVIALLDSFEDQMRLNEVCDEDFGPPIQIASEGGESFKDIERALMECNPVKSHMERLYRDRQVYVDAANAILVGAALIAIVTFASWLQPPLNYTSYFGEGYSSSVPAPSTSNLNYADVEHNIALHAFWVFNALSFYFAIGTVVCGARNVLPRSHLFIKKTVEKLRTNLLVTSIFLAFSVLFVIIAFGIAGTIVLTPLLKYQWCMIAPTIIGGMVCIISLGYFFKSMKEIYLNRNVIIIKDLIKKSLESI